MARLHLPREIAIRFTRSLVKSSPYVQVRVRSASTLSETGLSLGQKQGLNFPSGASQNAGSILGVREGRPCADLFLKNDLHCSRVSFHTHSSPLQEDSASRKNIEVQKESDASTKIRKSTETANMKETLEPLPSKPAKPGLLQTFKELGVPFIVYWTGVWAISGLGIFAIAQGAEIDMIAMLRKVKINLDVDPAVGNAAVAFAVNEALEVVRFPFCLLTFKKVYGKYKEWKNISP